MTLSHALSRRAFVVSVAGCAGASLWPSGSKATPLGKLEKPNIALAISVPAAVFLPVYIAADRFWQSNGLRGKPINFRGDAEIAQALVSDSIDVAVLAGDGLVNLIRAGADCIGFYAGFHGADFAWISLPSIKTWDDVKGTSVGVTTYGSMTDQCARFMLRRHNLEPLKDVKIVQGGAPGSMYQLLKSGRIQGAVLAPPYHAMAIADGFNVLATQAEVIAPQWPKELFVAKTRFIDAHPNTLKALLRAHVSAIRLANVDPSVPVAALMQQLKITESVASATWKEIQSSFVETGMLPTPKNMELFWSVAIATGRVTEPWPNSRLLDERFIKTFSEWAP
jgi:ABC-type nitrate/sulfonate/bicarbonate transport system substrate-binding protein